MRIIQEKQKLQESAFLVGEKTIQDIIELFEYTRKGNKIVQLTPDKAYRNERQALYALNALALAGRYGDDYSEIMMQAIKNKPRFNGSSFVQKYKSLQAFLYQCYEEPADKEPLFKYLWGIKEEMKKAVGLYIEETPEYDKCYWGD